LVGKVEIELSGIASSVYEILEAEKEITRLQHLEHLGVLQGLFPGMKNTRWDYTVLILHIARSGKLEGTSSLKRLKGVELTGRDMLEVMALIANIGHVPGTFAIEKGIARAIHTNNNLFEDLRKASGLDGQLNISQIDYLSLNKLLCLLKLQDLRGKVESNKKKIIEVAYDLAKDIFTNEPRTEHRKRILFYFNQFRRIAYQYLDSFYIDLPLKLELAKFISDLPKITSPNKSELNYVFDILSQYTRILYSRLYHSEQARKAALDYAKEAEKYVSQGDNAIDQIRKLLLLHSLPDELITPSAKQSGNRHLFSGYIPTKFGMEWLIEAFRQDGIEKLETELEKKLQTVDADVKVVIFYVPGLKESVSGESTSGDIILDVVYTNDKDRFKTLAALTSFLRNKIRTLGEGYVWKEIFQTTLSHFLKDVTVDIKLFPYDFFRDDRMPIINEEDKISLFFAGEKEKALRYFKRNPEESWGPQKKEEFAEVSALRQLLKKTMKAKRGIRHLHLIVPGRVSFWRGEREVCEFDGAQIKIAMKADSLRKLELHLVEAKTGHKDKTDNIKKLLKEKLRRLGVPKSKEYKLGKKSAYSLITLHS